MTLKTHSKPGQNILKVARVLDGNRFPEKPYSDLDLRRADNLQT